jgi:hypothetical protein
MRNNRSSSQTYVSYKSLDAKMIKRALSNINSLKDKYNIYHSGVINDILFSLFDAIDNCELTYVQKERLDMWINGYTETEIANRYGVSRWVISKSLIASCNKIMKYLEKGS